VIVPISGETEPRDAALRPLRPPRRHPAPHPGAGPAPGPEDGRPRPARRRGGPRLQQPPDRDHGVRLAADPAGVLRRLEPERGGRDPEGGQARRAPDPAAPGLQPPAGGCR
jgi:hypothetical protein